MPMRNGSRGKVLDRPANTRCYVPGFLDDGDQFKVDQENLGIAPLALLTQAPSILGIKFGKSPRYGTSDGPLYSTVEGKLQQVLQGGTAIISELDRLRKYDQDKVAWGMVWTRELPKLPVNQAQYNLIKSLDPSLPVKSPAVAVTPGTPIPQPLVPQQPIVSPPPQQPQPGLPPIQIQLPGAQPQAPPTQGITVPQPTVTMPGGEPTIPERPVSPMLAGLGISPNMLILGGLGLLALVAFGGGKGRR